MKANVERIEAPPNASFVFRRRREPDFGFFWHRHPEVELTLIVKSRGRRFVGDSIADYEPGDLVLLGRDLPHTWHSERARRGGERADARYVQFREDFLGPAFFERPELARVKDLLARARRGLQFTGRARAKAAGLLLGMDGLDPERRLLALLEILDALARDRDAVPLSSALFEPPSRQDEARIDRVCRYLTAGFLGELSQPEAARLANLSVPAFSRFFRRSTGKSFTRYVNELRIGHACRMLIETDKSVSEIAFASGFQNLSNFNRRFRELKRAGPREFRRQFAFGGVRDL